ncbi:MAG TPA: sarcosine oxidase subunit gamma family protein [Pseudonocardia sp.]
MERECGLVLPLAPNTVAEAGGLAALWMGPDEWLVIGPPGQGADLRRRLADAVTGRRGAAVDVSANRVTVELSGPDAREVLEQGCPLDLHPRSFGAGRCAQTLLARAPVVLWQTSDRPDYRLLVRPSFAAYLKMWLAGSQH